MTESDSFDLGFQGLLAQGFTPQQVRDQLRSVMTPESMNILRGLTQTSSGMDFMIDCLNSWRSFGVEPPWDDDLIATVEAASSAKAAAKNDLFSP